MIEISFENREIVNSLYEKIKSIVLSKKDNSTYYYKHNQHHLYEESEYPGISKNYYNEDGEVTYINSNNQTVNIRFSRIHPHKHNGYSGLNGIPILNANISINDEVVWKLVVESGTLHYKAFVSSTTLPLDILIEKETIIKEDEQSNEEFIVKPVHTKPPIDISNIQNKNSTSKKKKDELLLEMKKEIERITNEIINKYALKIESVEDSINTSQKELKQFDELVDKYSTFDISLIEDALTKLISFMENSEYTLLKSQYTFTKRVHGPIDSWDEQRNKKCLILIAKEYVRDIYDKEQLHKLVNLGKCIVLDYDYKENESITIYTSKDGQITCNMDFKNFEYVKDFFNILIKHRYDYDTLTGEDINRILKDFLLNNKSTIIDKIGAKVNEKILQLI